MWPQNISQVSVKVAPGEAGERKAVHHLGGVVGTPLQRSRHQQRGSERWLPSVTSGNESALLCALPPHGTLQQREQRLRAAKSRISVERQSHRRTEIIHRSWDAGTQPLPMTFPCRRARQHQPWVWQNTLQLSAKVCQSCHSPLAGASVSCDGWRLPHWPACLLWGSGGAVNFCYVTKAFLCNCSSSAAHWDPIIMEDEKHCYF